MKLGTVLFGACVSAALFASSVQAAQIDSATSTVVSGTLIDFEGRSEGELIGAGIYAGATFSQPDGGRPQIDNDPFLFGYGASSGVGVLTGSLEGGAPFPTVAGIIVTFATGVSAIEAFLSDTSPLGSYDVQAFDSSNVLIDSFTISGPSRYVGFTSATADIFSIQFGPSSAFGDAFAIDDLRFVSDAVIPEPATWTLLAGGVGLIGAAMRRRRRASASA